MATTEIIDNGGAVADDSGMTDSARSVAQVAVVCGWTTFYGGNPFTSRYGYGGRRDCQRRTRHPSGRCSDHQYEAWLADGDSWSEEWGLPTLVRRRAR